MMGNKRNRNKSTIKRSLIALALTCSMPTKPWVSLSAGAQLTTVLHLVRWPRWSKRMIIMDELTKNNMSTCLIWTRWIWIRIKLKKVPKGSEKQKKEERTSWSIQQYFKTRLLRKWSTLTSLTIHRSLMRRNLQLATVKLGWNYII